MWPKVGGLGWDPNMSSPFKSDVVLKVEGAKIGAKSIVVPRWHLIVSYISSGSKFISLCSYVIDISWNPTLLFAGAR